MTALNKNRLAWAGIMLAGLCFGLGAIYLSGWFVVPFLANVFGAHVVLERIVCPNCGAPLTFEGKRLVDLIGGWILITWAVLRNIGDAPPWTLRAQMVAARNVSIALALSGTGALSGSVWLSGRSFEGAPIRSVLALMLFAVPALVLGFVALFADY